MTTQTKTKIDFADVHAIEFECNSCHAKMTVPLATFREPPVNCYSCESEQWLIPGSTDHSDYRMLAQIFARIAKRNLEHFSVRLELSTTVSGHAST